jgi:hypothetical protein
MAVPAPAVAFHRTCMEGRRAGSIAQECGAWLPYSSVGEPGIDSAKTSYPVGGKDQLCNGLVN